MTGSTEARDEFSPRVEAALERVLAEAAGDAGPPRLREALARAVFGGGGRLRPTLCLAVAAAHGDRNPAAAERAAAALELVHCASLVHDDLPCFDDAQLRRGRPTVHATFGVPTAVLAGDALIVAAFGALAATGDCRLLSALAEATGPARGIVAGQAWEGEAGERAPSLDEYHRAKTASLFAAAAAMGALTSGGDARAWSDFGALLGCAYQALDDVLDATGDVATTGKTGGRDAALARPSVVRAHGLWNAKMRIGWLMEQAARALPPCPDPTPVSAWLARFTERVLRASSGATGPDADLQPTRMAEPSGQ